MVLKILKIISGPLIGAVIGYITNYIAVKMLFRPYKEKRIGKIKIPFTPGIIPKRQSELAKAVGQAVGKNLFTENDLINAFENITFDFKGVLQGKTLSGIFTATDNCEDIKTRAVGVLTQTVYDEVTRANLGSVIAEQGKIAFAEKKSKLGMLAFMVSDDLINSVALGLSEKVNEYISNNGREFIEEKINAKINSLTEKDLSEICENELIDGLLNSIVKHFFVQTIKNNVEKINVSAVVEEKVKQMDVKELEKLCMSVMKKELSAVVNLGALIGLLLGIVNIFI